MAVTLQEIEAVPSSYPAKPSGLSTAAAALSESMVWHRIERWIATRWTSRAITWIAEGSGEWLPRLSPATISTTEIWNGSAWEAVTLTASPLGGYCLDAEGPYRFTGTVGSGTVPEGVNEAYRRLAEYIANGKSSAPGVTSRTVNVGGDVSESFDRPNNWLARALAYSGAADLLRDYRGMA